MAYKVVQSKEEIQTKKGFFGLGKPKVAEESLPNLKEIFAISLDAQVMRAMHLDLSLEINMNKPYVSTKAPHEIIARLILYYDDNRQNDRLYVIPHVSLSRFSKAIEVIVGALPPDCDYLDDFVRTYEDTIAQRR